MTQRLKAVQSKTGTHHTDAGFTTAFTVRFEFQSDEGAYPDAMFYSFKKDDTPEQVVEGLKCMIRHLETKLSKS